MTGVTLDEKSFKAVMVRYSNRERRLTFEDFISCTIKLKTMYGM